MQTDPYRCALSNNAERMLKRRATATGSAVLAAVAVLLAAGSIVAVPAQAASPQTIAVEPFVSKLSAYGGVLVWSHWDGSADAFRLLARFRGRTEVLPVATRTVPFDVDLGPDTRGRAVAVYSRCRHEVPLWVAAVAGALPSLPSGCTLYRYDFTSRRESRIAGIVGGGSGSFYLPTIWRNELAYVRLRGSRPALYAQPLSAPRRHRIVAVALRGGAAGLPGPTSLDLRGNELAFSSYASGGTQSDSEIRLDTFSAVRALTGDGLDGESSQNTAPGFVGFPSLSATGIFYGRFDGSAITPNDDAFELINSAGAGGAVLAPHALRAQVRDGNTTYAMFGPYGGTFSNCGLGGCTLSAFVGLRPAKDQLP